MGNYLPNPNCHKNSASGASQRVTYGVSSMQGWRVSMEDAHLIYHDFPPPSEAQWPRRANRSAPIDQRIENEARRIHLFGVFDGHGGPQISKYASNALIDELKKCPQFAEGNYEIAFRVAYCNIDRVLRSQDWPRQHAQYMTPHINDGRSQTACMDNHKSSHCLLAGSQLCADCGCPVPTASTNTAIVATAEKDGDESVSVPDTSQFADLDSDHSCDSKSTPNTAALLTSERRISSQLALSNSFASSLKHAASNFLTTTSRICSNLLAATGAVSVTPTSAATRSATSNEAAGSTNPAMYAGCTAICALLVENTLYVANVGDSRAVLCRGGRAETLSQDHKPTLPEERNRIYAAGGFVEYGRVNGNLNLSRALGDLVYKQDITLAPEKQIVTGYPDVRKIELVPEDEFLVIGCDGIWEYFSSQDVVDFVLAKLRRKDTVPTSYSSMDYAPQPASRNGTSGTKREKVPASAAPPVVPQRADLSNVIEDLFESLISPNPSLFEYGCDNMTAILIDLRPGHSCECHCHSSQREVQAEIFAAMPRKASTASVTTVEEQTADKTPPWTKTHNSAELPSLS